MVRVSIRSSVYRGREGYTVSSGASKVFCRTREQAEAYRELIRAELPFEQHCARSHEILCGVVHPA